MGRWVAAALVNLVNFLEVSDVHDGSITFSTALDNKQLEKDLSGLTKKIEKKEQEIADLSSKRDKAKEKSLFDGAALDAEKAKLQEVKDRLAEIRAMARDKNLSLEDRESAKALIPSVQEELKDQQTRVNGLQTEWNKTQSAVERYSAKLSEAEAALDRQKEEAGYLMQQIEEARQSIARLKGALLTLAQPLVEVIIPAFTALVNVLTRIITAVAQLVSMLFGKTLKQSSDGAKALWKISGMLPGVLGTIAQKLAGILLTIGGLLFYWHGLTDAWENGVDWLNLIEMIGGLAAAALGLYLLFGPIAAGIALIAGGLGMLAAGFRDAMENGWNLQNTLLSIAGILAAGLGISLITGSWIPLLIVGIASVLLALTVATGHGEELIAGIRTILEGFIDFFTGAFSGDIEKAADGIEKIFDGLKTSIFAMIDGAKEALQGLVKFVVGVFTTDWDTAWKGVKDIFKGV